MKHFILAILCLVALVAFTSCEKEEEFVNEYKLVITNVVPCKLVSETPNKQETIIEKGTTNLTFKRTTKQFVSFVLYLDQPWDVGSVHMELYVDDKCIAVVNQHDSDIIRIEGEY